MKNIWPILLLAIVSCGADYASPAEEYYKCMAEKVAEYGEAEWIEGECRYYANYYQDFTSDN